MRNHGDLLNTANQQLERAAHQRLVYYIDYYDAIMRLYRSRSILRELFEIVDKQKIFF